jgi:uncharacterized protein (TIGR02145 family)
MIFGKWRQLNKKKIESRLVFLLFFVVLALFAPSSVKADLGLLNGKMFSGETDNYLMWLQTRDSSYNYTDRFFIDKVGNVGINTTTPAVKLDIDGGTEQVVDVSGGRIMGLNLIPQADSEAVSYKYVNETFAPLAGGVGSAFVQSGNSFGTTAILGTNDNYDLSFITNGTNRMTVDSGGNVGIGSVTPTADLDVVGNVNASVYYDRGDTNYYINPGASIMNYSAIFKKNVGIGITTPSLARLQVSSVSDTEGIRLISSNYSPLVIRNTADTSDLLRANEEGKLSTASSIKPGDDSDLCSASNTGAIKHNSDSNQSYICDGTRWLNQKNCGVATDEDGNTYGTVEIGGQCWLAENINVGTMLASGSTEPNTSDAVIEKWCYNNDPALCEAEGGLYNWNEAMRGSTVSGAQGICPSGWHIPTDGEINELEKTVIGVINSSNPQYPCSMSETGWRRCADDSGDDVGGTYGAGNALRQVGLGSGVGSGTDLVGWSGNLPGYRSTNGSFYYHGSFLYLWSSSEYSSTYAWSRRFYSSRSVVYRYAYGKGYGFSVRCLRD